MPQIVFVSDLVNPETGLTVRQENERVNHKVPVGALVEILRYNSEKDSFEEDLGLRLYVAKHTRDCDGTPLYTLSAQTQEEIDSMQGVGRDSVVLYDGLKIRGDVLIRPHFKHGFSEDSLKVIKADHTGFYGG